MKLSSRCLIVGVCTLISASAFADSCLTQSKGLWFYATSSDVNQATSVALNQCRAVSVTDNNECSNNLKCGRYMANPYPSGQIACSTSSRSLGFQLIGSQDQLNTILSNTLSSCHSNSLTDNNECDQNISCADSQEANLPYPSGEIRCSTNSHSIPFDGRGSALDINTIVSNVVSQCRANPATDNNECEQALSCRDAGFDNHDGDDDDHPVPHDGITCRTYSHNINFSERGSRDQVDQLTNQVLNECRSNAVTDNNECANNLSCE